MTLAEFYAARPERKHSPEWDYGVMWREGPRWPTFRVSWIVETGELYAYAPSVGVKVLGVVPRSGEYPHGIHAGRWRSWVNEQLIEKVMEGWSTNEHGFDLSWVRARLVAHEGSGATRSRAQASDPASHDPPAGGGGPDAARASSDCGCRKYAPCESHANVGVL